MLVSSLKSQNAEPGDENSNTLEHFWLRKAQPASGKTRMCDRRSGSSVENRPSGVSQRACPHVRANIFSTKKKNLHSLPHTFLASVSSRAAPNVCCCCCTPAQLKNSTLSPPPLLCCLYRLTVGCTHIHTHLRMHTQRPGVL